jgi:hypothetical protein
MSFYKPCNKPTEGRTQDYRFSIVTKQDPDLINLKLDVAKYNAAVRKDVREFAEHYSPKRTRKYMEYRPLHRIRIMARGARAFWAKQDGAGFGAYDSSLPHKYAEYFDVYRGEDSHAMYYFREQIELMITPSQQRLINSLSDEAFALKLEHMRKAREAGLVCARLEREVQFVGAKYEDRQAQE